MTFRKGQLVKLTADWRTVDAVITIASPNGKSLFVRFEAILNGHGGCMPLLQDDSRSWLPFDHHRRAGHHRGHPMTARIFAHLPFTCSVCAERSMGAADIEHEVSNQLSGDWLAVDLSRVRKGPSTPNPCNCPDAAATHLHWFLMTREIARKFGFAR